MSESFDIGVVRVGRGETWQATAELRWTWRMHPADRVLQQAWRCLDDGRTEWRDVPVVDP